LRGFVSAWLGAISGMCCSSYENEVWVLGM
jgi:hypothetical protein